MAKLVLAMFMSLDGYVAGPNGEFVPPPWSAEVGEAWVDHNLTNAGHLIYGRANFEFNKAHWTSPAAAGQPETETMNRLPKTVVSRSLSGDPGWNGKVVSGDLSAVVAGLKRSVTQGDVYSFGGAGLAENLMPGGGVLSDGDTQPAGRRKTAIRRRNRQGRPGTHTGPSAGHRVGHSSVPPQVNMAGAGSDGALSAMQTSMQHAHLAEVALLIGGVVTVEYSSLMTTASTLRKVLTVLPSAAD